MWLKDRARQAGKRGLTAYQLEHTVLQLISDHVWNNHQEDKTAWFESEIGKSSESITKLQKLGALTDDVEALAEQINDYKQKKINA